MKFKWNLLLIVFVLIFSNKAFAYIYGLDGKCLDTDGTGCPTAEFGTEDHQTLPNEAVPNSPGNVFRNSANTAPFVSSSFDAGNNIQIPGYTCGNYLATDNGKMCCTYKPEDKDVAAYIDKKLPNFGCLMGSLFCVTDPFKAVAKFAYQNFSSVVMDKVNAIKDSPKYKPCISGIPQGSGSSCTCVEKTSGYKFLCESFLKNNSELGECTTCASSSGIWTGFGCIYTNIGNFIVKNVFGTALGFAGIAAILLIIYSAFLILTSSGDPEKLKKAKELLTSCLTGLVFIILSVFILKFIGVDILGIPKFGK